MTDPVLPFLSTRLGDGSIVTPRLEGESEETHAKRHRDRWREAAGWYPKRSLIRALRERAA